MVGYVLNGCAFSVYAALVIYLHLFPDGDKWFIPFALAGLGLAETLPVQQYYLIRMYGCTDGENIRVRKAVKTSHTGTGIGSMAAFLCASQIYDSYGISGVAYVGISIQAVKILTNVIIDLDYYLKNKAKATHTKEVG